LQKASATIYQGIMPKPKQNNESDSPRPFNPLAKAQIAISLTEAFLLSELHPLPPSKGFVGAGVYAVYYFGELPLYHRLVEHNSKSEFPSPIYVGKAIPSGGRKGGMDFEATTGRALTNRLSDHADSVRQASNLRIQDFKCRYLIVDDIWIPLAESMLIQRFRPLWNVLVDGFGNHDPGAGRHKQKTSWWDVLHPGRRWVERLQPCAKTKYEIESEITDFLRKHQNP
jgi:hypothetical protein